ncbi:MAG: hypothetical protein IPL84_17740 [Chitinophagaceae bacterium]|nr:hypothetical protein [Chitinophagaceae bacterium]
MKLIHYYKPLPVIFCLLLIISCTKSSDTDPVNNPAPAITGTFTFNGEVNTGTSLCYTDASNYTGTGLAARITLNTPGYIKNVTLGNLPLSGSVAVSDKYDRIGCYSCPVIFTDYGLLPFDTEDSYESFSGTITKTSTGYSFSALLTKTYDIGTSGAQKYSLTGSLNCQ